AHDSLALIMERREEQEFLSKQAEEGIDKLGEEEKAEIRNYMAYGQGLARGEYIGKQAGFMEGTAAMLDIVIQKTAKLLGKECAIAVRDEIYKEAGIEEGDVQADEEIEGLREEIRDSASEQLIEAAGGMDNISVEEADELADIADTAADIGVQQVIEGGGEDNEDDGQE
ncbi:MAG: hypothetical protein Q8M92_01755, partial [Candidatus Subteraquimicrobiales bacterium]|nr:hypothetical protein [Candidatus Subteraquimicrobiales bacterium]